MIRSRTTRIVRVRLYFVLPAVPRVVAHLDLRHLGPVHLRQHRDEAVHLAVQRQRLGQVAPHRPERAAHVLDAHAGHLPDQPVAQPARRLANQRVVLAVLAQAEHGVVTLRQLLQQHRDVGRVVLQVAVHRHEHVALRPVDAGPQRRRLAEVAPHLDHLDARVGRRQLLQHREGAVHAAVVDEQDLVIVQRRRGLAGAQRLQGGAQPIMQRPEVVALVLDRNHHR